MSKEVPKPYDNEVDFEIIPDKEKIIEKFDSKVSGNYNYSNIRGTSFNHYFFQVADVCLSPVNIDE